MILEDTILTKSEYIRHAANIAEKHRLGRFAVKNIPDTAKCGEIISKTYSRIMTGNESAVLGMHAIPSDEWIADNYHLVREAIEAVTSDECQKQLRELKKASSILSLYDIADEIAAHTDGIVGETQVLDFISAYEKVRPLEAKELAYICRMLQIALINRIAEICSMSDKIYEDRKAAEKIFREFVSLSDKEDKQRMRSAKVLFENEDMLSPVFAETILRMSAEQEENSSARIALSRKLAAKGTTVEELISREHKMRISLGVSAGNAIKSLQGITSLDWDKITSVLCVTEQILSKDPVGIFRQMTSKSRAEYVRLVGVCAKRRGETPEDFALKILARAEEENEHVGKYIYEEYTKRKDFGSFLLMFLFTAVVLAFCPVVYACKLAMSLYGIFGVLLSVACAILILCTSLNISLTLIQQMYMEKRMPFALPELDFHGNLPENVSIMIVLPCLINSKKRIDEMMDQLEAAAWANPQQGIYYTLLADLPEFSS